MNLKARGTVMAEERITEVQTPSGNTHTSHTIVERDGRRGGSGWIIAIVLVLALLVGGYMLMQGTNASTSKDDAIAQAAGDVGNAAQKVGDAAEKAVDQIEPK
jgi:uncharacterized protein HemX